METLALKTFGKQYQQQFPLIVTDKNKDLKEKQFSSINCQYLISFPSYAELF